MLILIFIRVGFEVFCRQGFKGFSFILVLFLNKPLELLLISHKTNFSWNSKVYVGKQVKMLSEIHCVVFA